MPTSYTTTPASQMTLQSTPGALVNPIIANMEGTSTADALVMDIAREVTVDAVFDAVLTEQQAVDFLNGFRISNPNGVDLTDRRAVHANSGVQVEIDKDVLQDALVNALTFIEQNPSSCAGDNDVDSSHTLKSYFSELLRDLINSQLRSSGLWKILKTTAVFNVGVEFEKEDAAEDMADKLGGIATVTNGGVTLDPAEIRKSFLMQMSDIDLQAYLRPVAKLNQIDFLPMKGAQSITFVFETTVNDPATLSVFGVEDTTPVPHYPTPGIFLDSKIVRRIAVIVYMGQKDIYFQRYYKRDDVEGLSQEIIGASQELYGLSNEMEYYSSLLAGLPYTLRKHAEYDTDEDGVFRDASQNIISKARVVRAALTGLNSDPNISGRLKTEILAALANTSPIASILAVAADTEVAIRQYNTALGEYLYRTSVYNQNPTPTPLDPQHHNALESARAALETIASNDRYLSATNYDYIRTQLGMNGFIRAVASTSAPYYMNYTPIDIRPATGEAVSAYNVAVQLLAIEQSLYAYYATSYEAIEEAQFVDRDAFERPILKSAADVPMTYTPTIPPLNQPGDLNQHNSPNV